MQYMMNEVMFEVVQKGKRHGWTLWWKYYCCCCCCQCKIEKKEKDADGNWTLLSGVIATDSAIASNNSLCNVKYKMSFTCF